MAVRFLSIATVGMQRAGALVAASIAASETRVLPLEKYSGAFIDLLRHEIAVDDELRPELGVYLRGLALWKRYGPEARSEVPPRVEIQDAWLSDPTLPSATGAVTPAAASDVPSLAVALHLVRPGNHTLTARGRLLRLLAGDASSSIVDHRWRPNPFVIAPGLGIAIVYALLDADGDLVRATYASLLEASPATFTRYSFAIDHLVSGSDQLRHQMIRRGVYGANVVHAKKLADLREAIMKTDRTKSKASTWGGGRSPDQAATVRLEPYVDVGLLTKDDRFSYTYRLDARQQQFFSSLAGAPDVGELLDRGFVAAYLQARGGDPPRRVSDVEIWERLAAAYPEMRSAMGYAAFHEVVLLALGRLVNEGDGQFFEVGDGIEIIRQRQRTSPENVQLTVGRGGGLRYMRIKEGSGLR